MVELSDHTAASFRRFETEIQNQSEIMDGWALGGGFDYLLRVVTQDIVRYQGLIDELLEARIGLSKYFTYVMTKRVKNSATPPFE